jgi:adenylate cyclase
MAVEIERKFLVTSGDWRGLVRHTQRLHQGYMSIAGPDTDAEVRIRRTPEAAYITIKGQGDLIRAEFEYAIPVEDAEFMLERFCRSKTLEKLRHSVDYAGLTWEIDEYLGFHEGLVVAEVELREATQEILVPQWVGKEVTGDSRFRNASLVMATLPFWRTS